MGNCIGLLISPEPKPRVITPSFPNSGPGSFMKKRRIRTFSEERSSSASASAEVSDQSSTGPNGENILERWRGPNYLRSFSYEELSSATNNFDLKAMLGGGGFGRVYKGWIDFNNVNMNLNLNLKSTGSSKTVVAIKKLNSGSVQGFEEWQSEVNFMGSVSHPNLVKLFGYCWEDEDLLLVYEYMPKGSLENHLFRRSVQPLSWDRRISIALGAARGLAFLHNNLDRQVIYRDFKASNVLLDGNYNAKLSDFGLAKIGPSGENSHVTTRIMGTFGYAAPEYMATGHLYVKSDVYGFGVVLLEILTGLVVIDSKRPIGKQNLIEWTRNSLSNKTKLLSNIMDSRIKGQYSSKAAMETARLAHRCLRLDPSSRPSMTQAVEALQLIKAMNLVHNKSKQA